ncbi:hypothetical protein HYH03_016807 [Edaphochlamys debaryana]|uniref:Uncharacterized protein n=1 Tax=Edaphochlamys debaryana TaxID=47281 RepID=A0A836BPW9_9CHLO|nr:hypothetical protein HYH03_016807 [Edaphochlamys debaryana]|eukprot:KAG2484392.1 hypothetical protein HYH03_016807 [Edaphochlamys debaryana]
MVVPPAADDAWEDEEGEGEGGDEGEDEDEYEEEGDEGQDENVIEAEDEYTMPFGQYEGTPLEQLPASYLAWAAVRQGFFGRTSHRRGLLKRLIALGRMVRDPDTGRPEVSKATANAYRLRFGKYKGERLADVDDEYVHWMCYKQGLFDGSDHRKALRQCLLVSGRVRELLPSGLLRPVPTSRKRRRERRGDFRSRALDDDDFEDSDNLENHGRSSDEEFSSGLNAREDGYVHDGESDEDEEEEALAELEEDEDGYRHVEGVDELEDGWEDGEEEGEEEEQGDGEGEEEEGEEEDG